jgi:hypothetical protein
MRNLIGVRSPKYSSQMPMDTPRGIIARCGPEREYHRFARFQPSRSQRAVNLHHISTLQHPRESALLCAHRGIHAKSRRTVRCEITALFRPRTNITIPLDSDLLAVTSREIYTTSALPVMPRMRCIVHLPQFLGEAWPDRLMGK